jgi:hypothetical protein
MECNPFERETERERERERERLREREHVAVYTSAVKTSAFFFFL